MAHDVNVEFVDLTAEGGYDRLARLYRYAQVGRCVSSVTHDMNNFLGAIMAYAELIGMDTPLEGEPARMLHEIVDGVKKCSGLVNDLTAIARKERRDVSLLNPADLVRRTLNLRRYDFRVGQIELTETFAPDIGDLIVDRPRLEQAVIYLLNNALESVLGTDGAAARIEVKKEPGYVVIEIADSGPPIPPPLCDRIFEPFMSTKTDEHIGLGLTIARRTAEYHGGSLVYNPSSGFVLTLPMKNHLTLDM